MKRILAILMCFTLIFSSSNVVFATENLGDIVAEEQIEAVEDTKTANEESTVILHFVNQKNWSDVYFYCWSDEGGMLTVINGETNVTKTTSKGVKVEPLGWSKGKLKANANDSSYYTVIVKTTGGFKYIFHDNKGTQSVDQTFSGGSEQLIFLYENPNNEGDNKGKYEISNRDIKPIVMDGTNIVFTHNNDLTASTMQLLGGMTGWQAVDMTLQNGEWTCTVSSPEPKMYGYKFWKNGKDKWYNDPNYDYILDNNNVCFVSRILTAPSDLQVTAGKTLDLPETLSLMVASKDTHNLKVNYELLTKDDAVTLNGNKLSVGTNYENDKVTLKATDTLGTVVTFDVTVKKIAVTEVILEETKELTVGDTAQLNAAIAPEDATNKTLNWESDNENVATVDANGVVTAKEEGTATITVVPANPADGYVPATCVVTVKDTITLDKTELSLELGATYALSATTKSKNTNISWSSDNDAVEVSDTGVVTAKKVTDAEEKVTITATTAGGVTATCEIIVTAATEDKVTDIILEPKELSVDIGKIAALTVQTNPGGKAVGWETSDPSVATVVGGVVTGVSAGTAIITATPKNPSDECVPATCVVTVNETIAVAPKTLDLVVKDTVEISKTTVPENTVVTWTTSDPKVATVDNNGVVTAVGYGTATITATTAGNNGIGATNDTVTVNVSEGITLKNTFVTLENGDTADLAEATEPTILAADKTLTWTSSDESVATVANGVVTAKKVGTAILTAKTVNGATATCVISVTRKLASEATIKIHFRNEYHWQNVKAYLWDEDEAAIPGYEAYHTYPGKAMVQDQDHPQWFTLDVVVTDVTKDINVILSDNGKEETKTTDIKIEAENFEEDGFHEIWVYRTDKTYVTEGTTTDSSWTNPFDSILVEDGKVTFRYKENKDEAGNVGSLAIHGEMNGWNDVNMTRGNDGIWTYTFSSLKAGIYKYRYIKNGAWITDPENGLYSGEDSVAIIPGIVLTDGVEAARGNSTKLPERMQCVLASGEVESLAVSYALKQALNGVSLSGNVLTIDEGFSGNKIQLTVSNKYEETAILDVAVIDGAVVVSPVVDDNAVTFNYRNANATKVYVAGSMTNWEKGKVAMAKDSNTNIWSVTIPNMKSGTHQYKFVVVENGKETWITDPRNDNVGVEGTETNSLVVVKGIAQDTNKITVKIHYTGRADYTNWNVWVWNDDMADQVDFEVVNGERIATVELEARASQYLKFIVRKGEWDEQEFGDRMIDLSDILSGTAHVYVKSGQEAFTRTLADDALLGVKIKRADYDRANNQVIVTTALPVEGNIEDAFTFDCVTDEETYEISNVAYKYENGINKYILKLKDDISSLEKVIKYYTLGFDGYEYKVFMPNVYADPEFEKEYTYDGKDLGATWSKDSTTFKLWAPTADDINLNLYESGTAGTNDLIESVQMDKGDKGVWTVVVEGDLNGKYYTYNVSIGGKTTEACDPYARTTGVNGKRAMVINLDRTDPEGWADDKSPNQGMDQTDAIIYELHVRDLSSDENSGITNKGKYLGVTETGTTNKTGQSTGLDHIIDLGVTHIHFLPIYDYGSVDETKLDTPQFNWGYDPVNYNVPEGSYSTDPYNGEVRVEELKEMVQTLHENNINVVMDVVYNHVYDAGGFAFNQIVPDYFSRTTDDGNYSSRSGCGNDTASERDMVRKYIVESVVYWAEEYHFDGFRFDLVGLLDVNTINQIVEEVHKINPSIIFYGEGWDMDGTVMNPREPLAKQGNAYLTPEFAYFSDTIRDLLRGNNDNATNVGYVSGLQYQEEAVRDAFMARTWWTWNPTQIVNYASCHDNYTVMDKLNEGRKDASFSDRVKMNNLSAAIYMLAEGVPLIHAGEEMLRTKVDENGHIIHNSYKSSDYVNSIKWEKLKSEDYQKTVDYYAGLIEFRKNHEALRLTTADKVSANVEYFWITNEVVMFKINGRNVDGEVSDGIIVIFNPTNAFIPINLYNVKMGDLAANIEQGTWNVCIEGEKAGIDVIRTVNDGNITVAPISTTVLVKGATVDEDSVYTANGYDPTPDSNPTEVEVTSVKLNKESVILHVGDTLQLAATVNPSIATNKAVTWTSSKSGVVEVDNTGKITAKAVTTEEVVITVTTSNGLTAECKITVVPENVPVEEVTLNKSEVELKAGENFTLTVGVSPSTATNKTVTWTTSDPSVVTVKDGKLTAVAAGEATITAEADGKTATCKVTVTQVEVPVTGVVLNKTAVELEASKTITLRATVSPAGATDKTVTWTTSDANVVSVDENGVVTAVAEGTATITVTTKDGSFTTTCTVTVLKHEHAFNKTVAEAEFLATPATCTAKATYYKSCECGVVGTETFESGEVIPHTWKPATTEAPKTCTVCGTTEGEPIKPEHTHEFTAVKVKDATCTEAAKYIKTCACGATEGEEYAVGDPAGHTWKPATTEAPKTCTVCGTTEGEALKPVEPEQPTEPEKPAVVDVTSITLDKETTALKKGEAVTLTATVEPENATDKTVTWTSSDEKVATVDANGKVTAVANGTATITAKAGDKTAACTVTVTTDVAGVKLNKSKANVVAGKTITLTATIAPSDASNQTVIWSSSDTKIATVDKNGKVIGKKAGTVTITATTANGKKDTCKVTVVEVTLNASTIPVQVGKTTSELKATSSLKGDKVASWVSSDKKIATVDKKTGKIKGIKVGTAKVTVTMKSGATATCKVTVQKAKVVTKKLIIDQKKVTLQKGKTVTLTVTRNPISATEKITWTSSNKKIATVDKNGKVKGVKAGTATITAKTSNGKKVTCKVTVKNPTVKLAKTKATIKVGKTTTIKIKSTFPENDTVKSYTSSNKKVATVDKNGKVKGVKAGTATITVKMKSGAKATFKVTVKK